MPDREVIVGEFGPEAVSLPDVDDSEEFGCGCEEGDCE